MPMGSGEAEPMLWGLDEAAVTPLNHPSELIIADHQFPSLGTLIWYSTVAPEPMEELDTPS
jgi:hypothetical protein